MARFATIDGQFGTLVHSDDYCSLDDEEVLTWFQATGAVLFRGQDLGLAGFEEFTKRFGGQFLVHGNPDRQRVSADDTTQEVQPGRFAIPLHIERGSTPFPPDVFWFYCKEPASAGGETIVCDGVSVRAALPAPALEQLSSRRIRWVNDIPAQAWKRAYGIPDVAQATAALDQLAPALPGLTYRFAQDESLRLEYVTQAIRLPRYGTESAFANSLLLRDTARPMYYATFEDGTSISDALYEDLQRAADPVTVPIHWRPGDILMLDNTRVMHGRNAFTDPARRVYVRMCQSSS